MLEQIAHSRLALFVMAGLLVWAPAVFLLGRGRATAFSGGGGVHSRPNYHGYSAALWAVGPALLVLLLYALFGDALADRVATARLPAEMMLLSAFDRAVQIDAARLLASGAEGGSLLSEPTPAVMALSQDISEARGVAKLTAASLAMTLALVGAMLGLALVRPRYRARNRVESVLKVVLMACSGVAILTTAGIILSLVFETMRFFAEVSPVEFLFGLQWSAQTQIRPDQVGSTGAFGAVPLLFGSLMITFIAMLVAAPVGLMSAIYLSEYASPRTRSIVKPVLEVLAGIPTVVYGFFALLTVAPAVKALGEWLNGVLMRYVPGMDGPVIDAQPTSALAAGLVMGVMIVPFVSSLSDDVINAAPQSLRDGSLALGATRSETIQNVVLPAALPGVVAAMLLAISRAIGETMIVVMAAGQRAQITADPFSDVTTITVQIVDLLTGDTEFDSPKTLSAFALGFGLFLLTLLFNVIAQRVVKAYREKYD